MSIYLLLVRGEIMSEKYKDVTSPPFI